jgi:hypothetical protein
MSPSQGVASPYPKPDGRRRGLAVPAVRDRVVAQGGTSAARTTLSRGLPEHDLYPPPGNGCGARRARRPRPGGARRRESRGGACRGCSGLPRLAADSQGVLEALGPGHRGINRAVSGGEGTGHDVRVAVDGDENDKLAAEPVRGPSERSLGPTQHSQSTLSTLRSFGTIGRPIRRRV